MMPTNERRKSVSGSMVRPPAPPKLAKKSLHRTLSDISLDFHREDEKNQLGTIEEVEKAKCECCGMREDCTAVYIESVKEQFLGKWICGLCSEAVKEEREKGEEKGLEGAMKAHMTACVRFNKLGREYPALFQAEAMTDILRRSRRGKSISPRPSLQNNKPVISRTSSCIPAITKDRN